MEGMISSYELANNNVAMCHGLRQREELGGSKRNVTHMWREILSFSMSCQMIVSGVYEWDVLSRFKVLYNFMEKRRRLVTVSFSFLEKDLPSFTSAATG